MADFWWGTSDLNKNGKESWQNPWKLWSDPCGTWLALGLKPLRLPRVQNRETTRSWQPECDFPIFEWYRGDGSKP